MSLTNVESVSLSVALWLANDKYDHKDDPKAISVTTLIKAPRQVILGSRIKPDSSIPADVMDQLASTWGTALHDSIEDAWHNGREKALKVLGHPASIAKRVVINPTKGDFEAIPNLIPIYMERRTNRSVGTYLISGKFDFVGQGQLEDFKSTGTFSYTSGSNTWKYMMQGSIYRWLNPDIITEDHMLIQFLFTDWSKAMSISGAKNGYPQHRLKSQRIKLLSIDEIDMWVNERVNLLEKLWKVKEEDLPLCGEEDLWMSKPVFKYYKKGVVTKRSSKNYNTFYEAEERRTDDACGGLVVEKKGEVKACKYCDAFALCTQKDGLIADGLLII